MGATVTAVVVQVKGEEETYDLTASDGANTTIKHGLGVEPTSVILTPVGDAAATATLISKNATEIVVNVSNTHDALIRLSGPS